MFRVAWVGDAASGAAARWVSSAWSKVSPIFQDKQEVKSETAKNDLMRLLSKK